MSEKQEIAIHFTQTFFREEEMVSEIFPFIFC